MRAIEGRRFLVRAANDGVSAMIGPSGAVVAQAPEFTQAILRGHVQPRHGTTPYLVVGNFPVIGAAAAPAGDNGGCGPLIWRRRVRHFAESLEPSPQRSCLFHARVKALRMFAMPMDRSTIKYVFVACSALVLSACSRTAATAVPPVQPRSGSPRSVAAAPAPLVTGLPDFTALVEHYGPAVVNVQVAERRRQAQTRGPQGADPNDPFNEFFRRFGIPNPNRPMAASAAMRRRRAARAPASSSRRRLHPDQRARGARRHRSHREDDRPARISGQGRRASTTAPTWPSSRSRPRTCPSCASAIRAASSPANGWWPSARRSAWRTA